VLGLYSLGNDIVFGYSLQGAFALCRVVKKNEHAQKMNDHEEPKAKMVGSSSSNGDFTFASTSNEPVSIANDIPSQASHRYNESQYSSPITSPYEVTPVAEYEPSLMETNPPSFWVSPDLILDSSKVLNLRNKGTSVSYF
jgi:hypothetical protein